MGGGAPDLAASTRGSAVASCRVLRISARARTSAQQRVPKRSVSGMTGLFRGDAPRNCVGRFRGDAPDRPSRCSTPGKAATTERTEPISGMSGRTGTVEGRIATGTCSCQPTSAARVGSQFSPSSPVSRTGSRCRQDRRAHLRADPIRCPAGVAHQLLPQARSGPPRRRPRQRGRPSPGGRIACRGRALRQGEFPRHPR